MTLILLFYRRLTPPNQYAYFTAYRLRLRLSLRTARKRQTRTGWAGWRN